MYEGDAPLAERRAQALSLDRALLAELLGQAELRELLDPDALAEVEARAAAAAPTTGSARDAEDVADLLRVLGDLTDRRGRRPRRRRRGWLAELEEPRRAIRVRIAGEERWVGDRGRRPAARRARRRRCRSGCPRRSSSRCADPLGDLVARYARTHGPFHAADVAARFGLGVAVVERALRAAGRGRPGGRRASSGPAAPGTEWCDAEVLRMLRRRSLAALRKEVEPVPPEALARFLPPWQGVGASAGRGVDGAAARGRAAAGRAGARVGAGDAGAAVPGPGYTPALLDELTAAGEVLWAGAGLAARQRRLGVAAPRRHAPPAAAAARRRSTLTPLHDAVLDALDGGAGAVLPHAVRPGRRRPTTPALAAALWDLVWAGHAHQRHARAAARAARQRPDAAPARRGRAALAPRPRSAGRRCRPAPGRRPSAGRWSLLPDRDADPTRRAHALAEALLDRHGVVTRGAVMAERAPGGFAAVYPVLKAFEESRTPGSPSAARACSSDRSRRA